MEPIQALCMCVIVVQLGLFVRLLVVRSGSVPDAQRAFRNLFLKLITLSSLYTGGRVWSYLNLMHHAVINSMGGLALPEWRWRSGQMDSRQTGVEGRKWEERKEGKLWSVFKMRGKGVLVCSRTQAEKEREFKGCVTHNQLHIHTFLGKEQEPYIQPKGLN